MIGVGISITPSAVGPVTVAGSSVRQTLYPASGRTAVASGVYGTLTWPTTQTAAQAGAPPQNDVTFDEALITGNHAASTLGYVGVRWQLDECTYAGAIDKVVVRIRAAQSGCFEDHSTIQPRIGTDPCGTPITLTDTATWYEFEFPLNPANGLPWVLLNINGATWAWWAYLYGEDEFSDLHAYGYEFEVLVYGSE
jgi:hypothetical protein